MKGQQSRRLVVLGVIALALILAGTVWLARGVVIWVRDLPNRVKVNVDNEEFDKALTDVLTEAVKITLREGDSKTRLEMLKHLRDGLRQAPEDATSYREEFLADVEKLCDSDDPDVAEAARELVRELKAHSP